MGYIIKNGEYAGQDFEDVMHNLTDRTPRMYTEPIIFQNENFENLSFVNEEGIKCIGSIIFINCTFENVQFKQVTFDDVAFWSCAFRDSLFDTICFDRCQFKDVSMTRVRFYGTVHFRTYMFAATFDECEFFTCRFESGCAFIYTTFDTSTFHDPVGYNGAFIDFRRKGNVYHNLVLPEGLYVPPCMPSDGSFIGWKVGTIDERTEDIMGVLIKLEICEDAKRCCAEGYKCRASKAKVLDISSLDGTRHYKKAYSAAFAEAIGFTYKVGKYVLPDGYTDNPMVECGHGIHFFMNKDDAIEYASTFM